MAAVFVREALWERNKWRRWIRNCVWCDNNQCVTVNKWSKHGNTNQEVVYSCMTWIRFYLRRCSFGFRCSPFNHEPPSQPPTVEQPERSLRIRLHRHRFLSNVTLMMRLSPSAPPALALCLTAETCWGQSCCLFSQRSSRLVPVVLCWVCVCGL